MRRFALWKDVLEAQKFLLDDLFRGVIETFSRHRVRSWFVIHMQYGNRALQARLRLARGRHHRAGRAARPLPRP